MTTPPTPPIPFPAPPQPVDFTAFVQRVQALQRVIATHREAVARGEDVELTGLDGEVAHVCVLAQKVQDTPGNERVTAQLHALMADLDDLGTLLNAEHAQVRQELDDLNTRRRAASAYVRAGNEGGGAAPTGDVSNAEDSNSGDRDA